MSGQPKKKKARRWLDIYVTFSISACIVFTIVILLIFCKTGTEPSQLITCFFGLFGGEVIAAALIKIFNIKSDKGGNDYDDGNDSD